jgi:hypothetical protein
MTNIEYRVLRCRINASSEQLCNVGIVALHIQSKTLKCKMVSDTLKLDRYFPKTNNEGILSLITHVGEHILYEDDLNVYEITSKVLPDNDNCLYFSEVKRSLCTDFEYIFNCLYEDIVDN